jgi:mRNA interferase MazF
MGKLVVGQIIASSFPFSDLSSTKLRPAIVAAIVDFENVILCQITSRPYSSTKPIKLLAKDFTDGKLPIDSYIRPDKLFTADPSIVKDIYGEVTKDKLNETHSAICGLFKT